MKIKNLVIAATLAITASGAFAAADSYLYWMVDKSVHNLISGESTSYSYATVSLDGTYLSPYVGETASSTYGVGANQDRSTTPYYWGVFESGNTFLFELWNYVQGGDDTIAGFRYVPYSELSAYIATTGGQSTPLSTPYGLTGVVPEPTSGLLMLFGLAGLALRRRKMA